MSEESLEANENPLEVIARDNGWKPESEWKGDPPKDGFKSAEDYVRGTFEVQNKQHGTIERLRGTVERVERNINDMAKSEAQRTTTALESQRKRLEAERQEAFDESDTEKFNKADKELRDTDQQINELTPDQQKFADGEEDFKKRNKWFGTDMAMTNDAESIAKTIGAFHKDLSPDDFYEKLEDAIKKKYPDEFRNEKRDGGSPVSGGRQKSKSKSKGFDSLTEEQVAHYELSKQYAPTLTKESYAKSIFEMESK